MKNKASALRAIVCALMLIGILSFVVSSFIPGVCADHDCAGERCFVCLCAAVGKNLSRIILAAASVIFIFAPAALSVLFTPESNDFSIKEQTPVYLKVKLSN
jgi:hypothetical protein